jgi:hypothetical protein
VAQDGVRVRASAGAASFRKKATLEHCRAEAEAQVKRLRQELAANPSAASRREAAARRRAAEDRQRRVAAALAAAEELQAARAPKTATTDPGSCAPPAPAPQDDMAGAAIAGEPARPLRRLRRPRPSRCGSRPPIPRRG